MTDSYYQSRINQALKFIDTHLAEEVRINDLAREAHFSSFHFQRIYKALVNETPHETLLRRKLERAASLLKRDQRLKVKEVAIEAGFGSVENFTRQFKQRYNITPSQLRKDPDIQNSRIYQEKPEQDFHLAYEEGRKRAPVAFDVSIEQLDAIPVALTRAVFGQDGSALVAAYEMLMAWYEARGNHRTGSRRFGMSIDDPDVTPANHYRYDFAVGLAEVFEPEGLIEATEIPGGLFAVLACQGDLPTVAQAWDHLYKVWLPTSGYVPRHYPAVEEFLKGPEQIGWQQFDLLLKIPIEKIN